MSQLIDWDGAYRNPAGPPPWNIGEAQPAVAALITAGRLGSPILDAGCGCGEASLALAAQGYTVVGADIAPTAVAAARKAAAQRGLDNATFVHADVTTLSGYDDHFSTILDCGLLHALPVESRDGYQQAIAQAAAPGAALFILAFARGALPAGSGPAQFTKDELRQAVSKSWSVDEIRPTHLYGIAASAHANVDEHDRVRLPGYLLIAHKPVQ
jgi:cyclopropane fatty-acyl-phospholipid synthase-like methyltransferase